MNAEQILASDEFRRCVAFHGHVCPGLSMGYRAAKVAMERLKETRAEDEELVAIVETDACSADAVQVLTGCTFGKGNFLFRDYGKMALTLLSRRTGRGVRVALRAGVFAPDKRHMALLQKVADGAADDREAKEFGELHLRRSRELLEMPEEELFAVEPVQMVLPARAAIEPSEPCARCGEPTMRSKLETYKGQRVCRGCKAVDMSFAEL
ncbi:MAG: fwdE [Desulfacinum sp.]|jgi:formylmethanofuran dehydrogenase subunit E|nr:fwdE [Desulfacinum sp.]